MIGSSVPSNPAWPGPPVGMWLSGRTCLEPFSQCLLSASSSGPSGPLEVLSQGSLTTRPWPTIVSHNFKESTDHLDRQEMKEPPPLLSPNAALPSKCF